MTDLLDPALHASGEIMEVFRTLRASSPVAWCVGRRGPGYWAITGHPELVEAARDVETFSSFWGTRPEVVRPEGSARPLHNLDPPEHGALRAVAARAVTTAAIDALGRQIDAIVTETVERLIHLGGGDVVTDIAEPIVMRVFAAWIGMAPEVAPALLGCVTAVHSAGAALLDLAKDDPRRPERVAVARRATEAMAALVQRTLDAAPAGSAFAQLHALSPMEAVRLGALFVEAGMPTLIDALGSGVVDLIEHPLVRIDEDLPSAIEELLRRASPIAQFARLATRRIVLAGETIEAGDQIVLWFASANRDERVFPDPDAFVLRRTPNPHVAFGVGPHRCIGAALGRRVLRSFFAAWPADRVRAAGPFERRASSYLHGYARAPIALRPVD
ncbi:MAG: cytochrome [Myxococcales bacterium]|nr:cytochrome [Myxococcales bacterium]